MYRRDRHQTIAGLLGRFDAALFEESRCYFAGGTAIALLLDEFRLSEDIDFLCADTDGYRSLRERVAKGGIQALATTPLAVLREARTDQYGIRAVLGDQQHPVKLEIVREARIALAGGGDQVAGLRLLAREDLMAEKLLANADRGVDRSSLHRDLIDLCVMIDRWQGLSAGALAKARRAYGAAVDDSFARVAGILERPEALAESLAALSATPATRKQVRRVLTAARGGLDALITTPDGPAAG